MNLSTSSQAEPPDGRGTRRTTGESVLLLVGSIGPLGYLPASGTASVALAGVPLTWLMASSLSPAGYALVTIAFAVVAVAIHEIGDRILGESDSRRLVWDELTGYFIAMFMVEFNWKTVLIAFLLERTIDIVKVPPANVVDKRWHNGVGVVLDDVIAGAYTCVILHGLIYLVPSLAA